MRWFEFKRDITVEGRPFKSGEKVKETDLPAGSVESMTRTGSLAPCEPDETMHAPERQPAPPRGPHDPALAEQQRPPTERHAEPGPGVPNRPGRK